MNPVLTPDQLRALADLVLKTQADELTCDEWLDRAGGYLEAMAAGRPSPEGAELVRQHLTVCPECREEFDALMAALRAG